MNTFDNMTENQIIDLAKGKGYTIRDAPLLNGNTGFRVGGSKIESGPDEWMNSANVRLWKIQGKK